MSVPTKKESVFDSESMSIPSKLLDFKVWLDEQIAKVPEEFRKETTVDIDTYDSYGSTYSKVEIYYYKPLEKDEIKAAALAQEERRQKNIQWHKEALAKLEK